MKPSIEKVAIIGAGALGAAYGSILYEMDPQCVCFIASGDRYEKLKRDGVVVNGKRYAIAVARPKRPRLPTCSSWRSSIIISTRPSAR